MEGLDTPCLLILTESLISANWVGQFKQARQSGVSRQRDTGANRQAAVVTPPADPVKLARSPRDPPGPVALTFIVVFHALPLEVKGQS